MQKALGFRSLLWAFDRYEAGWQQAPWQPYFRSAWHRSEPVPGVSACRNARQSPRPPCVVLAVPPRSGVRGPLLMVSSMALTMASCAARPAPWPWVRSPASARPTRSWQSVGDVLAIDVGRGAAPARTGWEGALGVQVGEGARPMVPVWWRGPGREDVAKQVGGATTTSKRPGLQHKAGGEDVDVLLVQRDVG